MRFLFLKKKLIFTIGFILIVSFLIFRRGDSNTGFEKDYLTHNKSIVELATQEPGQDQKKQNIYPSLPTSAITTQDGMYLIKDNEIWVKKGITEERLTVDSEKSYEKGLITLSPNQQYLAYFQDLPPQKGMSNDDYYWRNYTTLRILNVAAKNIREAYRGSFKVWGYEWLSDTEIAIRVGCGSECSYLEIIDLLNNKKRQLMYGVGYTWTPNKKYILAYHYAIQAGITVGDKFGNTLFTLKRGYPENNGWSSAQKAVWSPDSSKLALIIHKNGQTELELSVFDVESSFKTIVQKDLGTTEFSELGWKDTKMVSYKTNKGALKEIKL